MAEHSERIRKQINSREEDEVGRLKPSTKRTPTSLAALDAEIAAARPSGTLPRPRAIRQLPRRHSPSLRSRAKSLPPRWPSGTNASPKRAAEPRTTATTWPRSATNFVALYADPDELLKHARVVGLDEIEENEFNLNIPRYVDTFEPEPRIEVKDALKALRDADAAAVDAETALSLLLRQMGYDA